MFSKSRMAMGNTGYCQLVRGPQWKNNGKWYTLPPNLLCNLYYIHINYQYGLGPHNTKWRAAGYETHAVD